MSMAWFGERHEAPIYADCPQTETPAGRECVYCDESIAMGDDGFIDAGGSVHHRECLLRSILGSVAHQERRCTCFGGTGSDQDDGMTRREGARAALACALRATR